MINNYEILLPSPLFLLLAKVVLTLTAFLLLVTTISATKKGSKITYILFHVCLVLLQKKAVLGIFFFFFNSVTVLVNLFAVES